MQDTLPKNTFKFIQTNKVDKIISSKMLKRKMCLFV